MKNVANPPAVLAEVFANPLSFRGRITPLIKNPMSGEIKIRSGRLELIVSTTVIL
jgi:hypothetical protein